METLRKFVEDFIGIPLSLVIPKDIQLYPLDQEDSEKAYLFGSKEAKKHLYLIQADIDPFLESCPEGYFLFGHWGYGVNSYALYYSFVDSWRKVLFRLGIGGCYMNNDKQAEYIRNFLRRYFDFEQGIRDKTEELIAIDSMGYGFYQVIFQDGSIYHLEKSLNFKPHFHEILQKENQNNGKRRV